MTIFFIAAQSYFDAGASMVLNNTLMPSEIAMNQSRYLQNCHEAQLAAHQTQGVGAGMLGQLGRELVKDK